MRARRARRQPRWFRAQDAYTFNGIYPVRFIQRPIYTWPELRRIAVRTIPLAVLLIAGMTALVIGVTW